MHLTAVRAPFCVAVFKMERVKGMLTFGRLLTGKVQQKANQLTGRVHLKANQLTGRVHLKANQLTGEAKGKAADFVCKAKGRVEDAKGKTIDLKRSAENKVNQVEARIHQDMLWAGVGAAATWVIAAVSKRDHSKDHAKGKATMEDRRLSLLEEQNLRAQQRITEIEMAHLQAQQRITKIEMALAEAPSKK